MRRPLFFALAALVPLLVYARTTSFGFVHADDVDLIRGNRAFLSDLRNAPRAFTRSYFEVEGDLIEQKTYYRPLAIVSFMLDAARAGDDPGAHHLSNVVLHAAVTCLLLWLAIAWGASPQAALAAALVFAVHPVNVQAVAWIAGRNELLLAAFGLLSLIAFTAMSTPTRSARPAAFLHVLAFAAALFSKETGLFFPVLAVLHRVLVQRAPLVHLQKSVLAADGVVMLVWALLRSQALAGMPSELSWEAVRAAAGNAPQVLMHLRKMLLPIGLNVAPGLQDRDLVLAAVALTLLGMAASRWLSRGATRLAAAWVLLFLLPTLLVAGLPAYEHRAYVPLAGVLLVFATASGQWTPGVTARIAFAVVLVLGSVLTWQRQEEFRNPFTYWTDAARDPRFGPLAHVNLGQLHEGDGRLADACREYLRALERDPATPRAHNNLGVALMKLGEPDLALMHFQEETRRHPWNADAWFNLGLYEELRGNTAAARRNYERAIAANPAYRPARDKLNR